MLEVCATEYVRIGASIQSIRDTLAVDLKLDEPLSDPVYATVTSSLAKILGCGRELNLSVCVGIANRFYQAYKRAVQTYHQVGEDIRILQLVFDSELETRRFFFVSDERARYYTGDVVPWLEPMANKIETFTPVISAFPSAEDDIREAGNCFALDRPTATVFHLMRVMEAGLKALGKDLGVAWTSNWGTCLNEIEKQATVKKSDPFFAEAVADLRAFKNAWRNPTMHIERIYSEKEAERIFQTVEGFMVHLATRLTE